MAMTLTYQTSTEIIDIASWRGEEESQIFPVGSREKKLVYSPDPAPFTFLKPSCRYLYKLSERKCSEQFWIELFSYHLSLKMGLSVPPTFVAIDSKEKTCGALIKWFLKEKTHPDTNKSILEKSESGGNLLQGYLPNFDHKKGTQHNLQTIIQVFTEKFPDIEWKHALAKTLTFDALIGNTDRHQDNWEVIEDFSGKRRLTPIFDNGTSMGHEIKATEFNRYNDPERLKHYVNRGKHHLRWALGEPQLQHSTFLKRYINTYPETLSTILTCLERIQPNDFVSIFDYLMNFNTLICLSRERAQFMLRLIEFRHQKLLNELGQQ